MPPRQVAESRVVHGHKRAFVRAGEGPALLLLHGIGNNCQTWAGVIDRLAETHTVIAPDLLGHGNSDKPRGDYSIAAYANGMRDLLSVLDVEQATVVGHSLGGGIAMQMAYQFPERVDRLVLVNSGGLGAEVNFILRAATLPGAEIVLPLMVHRHVRTLAAGLGRVFGALGHRPSSDLQGILEGFASLTTGEAQRAFLHTARSIIDISGQRVSARDRLYLAGDMPTLIIWGARDPMIPVAHAYDAHGAIPHSRLEVFESAGHFPFNDEPVRFSQALSDFIRETDPADLDEEHIRRLLLQGGA
jgi:pimeloyl-ACP methyl ester carboxylesterase